MERTNKKLDIEHIREYVTKCSPGTKLVSSDYINNKTKLEFICGCGNHFEKNWSTIQQFGTCLCNSCAKKKGWNEIRRKSGYLEEWKEIFLQHGLTVLDKIENTRDKVLCIDEEGYKGYISLQNLQRGKMFSKFSVKYNRDNLLDNLNCFAKLNNLDVRVLAFVETEARLYNARLTCKCKCGNVYETTLPCFFI